MLRRNANLLDELVTERPEVPLIDDEFLYGTHARLERAVDQRYIF